MKTGGIMKKIMKNYEKAIDMVGSADAEDFAKYACMLDFYGIFASSEQKKAEKAPEFSKAIPEA